MPTEKKSTSRASWSAQRAADGISIMHPTGIFSSKGMPSARSSSFARRSSSFALRSSCAVATIGHMIAEGPAALARRIARTWVRKTLRLAKSQRMERQPRKGFASCDGVLRMSLSPPMSSARKTTRASGPIAAAARTAEA